MTCSLDDRNAMLLVFWSLVASHLIDRIVDWRYKKNLAPNLNLASAKHGAAFLFSHRAPDRLDNGALFWGGGVEVTHKEWISTRKKIYKKKKKRYVAN